MDRFGGQARYALELPRNAELLRITGIRLQRIHFSSDTLLDACEVLSQVRTLFPLDLFFKYLSITAKQRLFPWRTQRVLAFSGNYSLNPSIRMLASLSWITCLTKQGHQGRVVIEIQDPGSIMRLDKAERQAVCITVKTLVRYGFHMWLDDVSPELFFVWRLSGIRFDTIKTGSGMFRQFRTSEWQLRALVNQFCGLGERVVIERVETPQDYAAYRTSGVGAMQDFLFEQKVLPKSLNHY